MLECENVISKECAVFHSSVSGFSSCAESAASCTGQYEDREPLELSFQRWSDGGIIYEEIIFRTILQAENHSAK